jgi:hypothetical protein
MAGAVVQGSDMPSGQREDGVDVALLQRARDVHPTVIGRTHVVWRV